MSALTNKPDEMKVIRDRLKKKFGSFQKAADEMNISKFTLSRILNGAHVDLSTHVRILVLAGYLKPGKYRVPRIDLDTFMILNGIIDIDITKGVTRLMRNGVEIQQTSGDPVSLASEKAAESISKRQSAADLIGERKIWRSKR